jgi:hypothetical protein
MTSSNRRGPNAAGGDLEYGSNSSPMNIDLRAVWFLGRGVAAKLVRLGTRRIRLKSKKVKIGGRSSGHEIRHSRREKVWQRAFFSAAGVQVSGITRFLRSISFFQEIDLFSLIQFPRITRSGIHVIPGNVQSLGLANNTN